MSAGMTGGGILHLVVTANEDAWRECLAGCTSDDAVVLLDAGVMRLTAQMRDDDCPCPVVASLVDCRARGLPQSGAEGSFEMVDDAAIAGLIASYSRCLSWS